MPRVCGRSRFKKMNFELINKLNMTTEALNTAKTKAMPYDTVLATGFSEDDYVEGVFLIAAKAEETFFNRKRRLEEITGFSDGFFDSYEEDEEGGIWRVITTAWFENVDEIKKALKKMEKYNWLYLSDSSILFDGEEIYCDGRWLV